MIKHLLATWRYRYFWSSLVRLDLRSRYRRSFLGLGWSLLHPLAMTVVWCLAFGSVFGDGDWRKFSCFLLAGMSVWTFITSSATQGCESFLRAEAYIRQCPLPLSIYPLRTVLGALIHFFISLMMMVGAAAILTQDASALLALPAAIPAIVLSTIFCWSISTLFAFGNLFFHDTKHLTEVAVQLLFFLTPIMFTPAVLNRAGLGWFLEINPAAHFLNLFRLILLPDVYQVGMLPPGITVEEMYLKCIVMTVVAAGLACGAMAWLQKKVIFYL